MASLREQWNKLRDQAVSMSPMEAAFIAIILIAIPIDIISVYFGAVNPNELQALKNLIKQTPLKELIYYQVILNPIQEEIIYRGLGRIFIFFFPPDTWFRKLLAWIIMLIPTYYWAVLAGGGGHGIPADAFFSGIVFSWILIKTQSLESTVAIHSSYNAVNLAGALIKYRFL